MQLCESALAVARGRSLFAARYLGSFEFVSVLDEAAEQRLSSRLTDLLEPQWLRLRSDRSETLIHSNGGVSGLLDQRDCV